MSDRRRVYPHPSRRRRPTRVRRPQRVPPRRPAQRHREPPGPPWRWIALIAGAVVLLSLGAFFAVRALIGTKPASPVPTAAVTATSPPTTASATTAADTPTAAIVPTPQAPDIPALQQFMLTLINEDRRANGLSELAWDDTAAIAGLRHAQEMARFGYLSHWDLEGHGPDYRYSFAGGMDSVRENVYSYGHSPGGGPISSEGWQTLIRQAQQELMESPMHRDNILAPEHTHVGIGIAYEPASGRLAIAQEFVNRYLTLQPLPHRISLDDESTLAGRLGADATSPLLNLAYEPLPEPMTVAELNATGTYTSPAEIYDSASLTVDDEGRFKQSVVLSYDGRAGLYHIRIWVDTALGQVLAADVVIEVQ